jgi:hypothetical protein
MLAGLERDDKWFMSRRDLPFLGKAVAIRRTTRRAGASLAAAENR